MKWKPNPEPFRLALGERGEMIAWNYLRQKGYRLMEKNFRCPLGEIDVIARKDDKIVFIEVKTRRGRMFGLPEEAVTEKKQKKIIQVASWYLKEQKKSSVPASFEVLAVLCEEGGKTEIRHIEDAFSIQT